MTGNYNGDLEFKSWNETTATAVACWKDAPQYCGTMYDFYPQCNVWMVGHYQNEWDGWMWGMFTLKVCHIVDAANPRIFVR